MSSQTIKTVIGFDYGTKSIGVAVGQSITGTAKALTSLKARDGIPNWDEIQKILAEWQPDLVIVGLPLDLHGDELKTITPRAQKFANRLKGRFNLNVELQDERLSTKEAKAILFERGGYRALDKGSIDSESAAIIVESWFEQQYG